MPKTLTETAIKAALPPPHGTITLWDASLRNFGLRVSQGGAKTFVVLIGSGRRQSIGRYPNLSLSEARREAKRILAEKTLGRLRPIGKAFEDAKTQFLAKCEIHNKPRTVVDYRRLLGRHFAFGRTRLADIKPAEVIRRLNRLNDTPSEKHHAFVVGRVFFRWCARQHYLERSPMENMDVPLKPPARERALTDTEVARVYSVSAEFPYPFGSIVQLLILTGQRRSEIGSLRWEWIDEALRTITLPASTTKNRRKHTFPYGNAVAALLGKQPRFHELLFPATRDHVRGKPTTSFNAWPKNTERLRKSCGIQHFTLHDLRRTFSSGMAALGVPQIVVEKLLNHVSGGTQSPIAQVYNRYSYLEEQRTAIAAWEGKLAQLAADSHLSL